MPIHDELATQLNRAKSDLIRAFDRKVIEEEEYERRVKELDEKIRERNKTLMEQEIQRRKKEEAIRRKKMEEQAQVEKEEKSKIGRKPVKESYATYIEKALKLKTVKSLDEVAEKVNEWKPGKDLPALKRMAKVIINEVKKQKQPRWKGYKWDESEFLLTEEE